MHVCKCKFSAEKSSVLDDKRQQSAQRVGDGLFRLHVRTIATEMFYSDLLNQHIDSEQNDEANDAILLDQSVNTSALVVDEEACRSKSFFPPLSFISSMVHFFFD